MVLKPGAHSGSLGKGAFCSHQYLCTDLATLLQQLVQAWWKLAVPPVQAQMLLLEASARCHQAFTLLWRCYVIQARVILVEGGTGCTLSPRAQTSS